MSAPQPPSQPIVVQVIQPQDVDETTAADIFIGSLGLTGALLVVALVLGGVLGGVLIGVKRLRARYGVEPVPDSEALKISPFP